jgi:hypothetical protein
MAKMTKEDKEWFHSIQKENYDYAIADGLSGLELKLKVESYALGLIEHIIDRGYTPKETVEMIKLVLCSEKILISHINASGN